MQIPLFLLAALAYRILSLSCFLVTKQAQHDELRAEIQEAGGALRITIGQIHALLWLEEKPQAQRKKEKSARG